MKKSKKTFKFKSRVNVWTGGGYDKDNSGVWRFARVPENISAKIKEMQKGRKRRGWVRSILRPRLVRASGRPPSFRTGIRLPTFYRLKNKSAMRRISMMV